MRVVIEESYILTAGQRSAIFTERIAVLGDVSQYLITAEACGVSVAFLGRKMLRDIPVHLADIEVAVRRASAVFLTSSPWQGRSKVTAAAFLVLFEQMLRKPVCRHIVLMSAEAVTADNRHG